MPRPRAIIAEDEPLLREELAELLGSLWPELDIVAQTGDGIATLREFEAHAPDVLFLDIQMPGLDRPARSGCCGYGTHGSGDSTADPAARTADRGG